MQSSNFGTGGWSLIGGVIAVAALLCSPMASANPAVAKLSPAEVQAIAEEGFVYGLPLVMNYAVMNAFSINRDSGQFKAPFNQIHCEANVFTHENTAVITPNSDTPYCLLWADLRAEPMVVSVPAVPKSRYYSVHLCDGNTFNYGFTGTRTTGPDAGDFLIVGPDWNGATPAEIKKVFRSSTQQSIVIFRTQLFSPADLPGVAKVQAGYKAQPLSAFLKQPPPPAAPAIDFPKIDDAMVNAKFFEYLDFVLPFGPPGPEEKEIRARLARIGVGPGTSLYGPYRWRLAYESHAVTARSAPRASTGSSHASLVAVAACDAACDSGARTRQDPPTTRTVGSDNPWGNYPEQSRI